MSGFFVNLRPVTEADACFILNLRQRSEVAMFMHKLDITLEQERDWIKRQRKTEGDYFFLIENKQNIPLGTIGLCNAEKNHCEIGRAASLGNGVENVEAFFLIFDLAFIGIGYDYMTGTVFPNNYAVKSLTQKFGVVHDDILHDVDGMQLNYGKVRKEDYFARREKIKKLIVQAHNILNA